MTMGTGQKCAGMILLLVALLVISAVPGTAGRGGHGFKGHGFSGHGFRGSHWSRGTRVFIRPSIIVPFGAYGGPYWEPYAYPPVVVAPAPRVYVQPSPPVVAQLPPPPQYWYYCDASQAYYPYVQQCPGGWRPVTPTPP
jgi:hypothetical protein